MHLCIMCGEFRDVFYSFCISILTVSLHIQVIYVWFHQYVFLINNDRMSSRLPDSDCIPRLAVLVLECLAIVILNISTIIVFVKQRQLRRQSTYLIIHLTIVNLLVGAVSGPLQIDVRLISICDLRNDDASNDTWYFHLKFAVTHLFSFSSLFTLILISLERLHATFRPFKHRFVKDLWSNNHCYLVNDCSQGSSSNFVKRKTNFPLLH